MLIHAAAGGVGLLLVQIAKILRADVIALASTPEKRVAAIEAGASHALAYDEDWVALAGECDVVYDAVGSTLPQSLAAARIGGHVVCYGMAGGNPQPVDPRLLMDRSLTLSGGDLWNVLNTHEERVTRANALFTWAREERLKPRIAARFALKDGAEAHRYLESRAAIGKVLLVP